MQQFEANQAVRTSPDVPKSTWVKPTLERLSLKDALSGGTTGSVDGTTPNGNVQTHS